MTAQAKVDQSPKRKPQARGNIRRAQLVEAATALLSSQEFDEISMADIAAKAGIPTASTYTLFTNVNAIFSQVTNVYSKKMLHELSVAASKKNYNHWREIIEDCCSAMVIFYDDNPAFRRIMLSGKAPSEIRYSKDRTQGGDYAQHLIEIIATEFSLPELENAHLIFTIVIDLIDGIAMSAYIREKKISPSIIQEAQRAAFSYLRLYLPEHLPKTR